MGKLRRLSIGNCKLSTRKEILEKSLETIYLRHYKREKLKHISRNDRRLPKVKVTSDIFSASIWFKDRAGKEVRMFIDGDIFLNDVKIHTITIDGEKFDPNQFQSQMDVLVELSKISSGYILASIDDRPCRVIDGKIEKYDVLLEELYNRIPESEKESIDEIYDWLNECYR